MSSNRLEPRQACPDESTLHQLLREELTPDATALLNAHITDCTACQAALRQLIGSLPLMLEPHAGTPEDDEDGRPPNLPDHAVLHRLNAGGMGVVWRIRDLTFHRPLALKVMKSRASKKEALVKRFLEEAQICAQLSHPFVVPVHAMGRLQDGRPYYTMKLVEGQTLASLLADRPAPDHRRMEFVQIFGDVCQAVAYAHSKGIVHRDLKPENVMVGAHGEVQVMDWGLAKVLDARAQRPEDRAEDATVLLNGIGGVAGKGTATVHGQVLGTVTYMPPEQARGEVEHVDERSDVFALGAILCKILTSEPPYWGEDRQAVLQQATRAALAGAGEKLRACGADAELIELALRCLSPEKADRPPDAGAVAAAVRAYRSGVEERLQQERLRRERQQVEMAEEQRRRKLWTGVAALVLLLVLILTAGLLVVNYLRTQEQNARTLAQTREQETRVAMDELSSSVIDGWLSHQSELTPDQKDFLQKGLTYYEQFIRETGETPDGRAALARAFRRVGAIRRRLGQLPEAERALQQAVQRSEGLAREFPQDLAYRGDSAAALDNLEQVLWDRGEHEKAASYLQQGIRYQQEVVQHDVNNIKARAMLAGLHGRLGLVRSELRQFKDAEPAYQQALHILTDLARTFPEVSQYPHELGGVHRSHGIMLLRQHKLQEADASFAEGIVIFKKLAASDPLVPEYRELLALCHTSRCETLWKLGHLEQARDGVNQAISLLKVLVADFPAIPRYRQYLANAFNNVSIVLKDLGHWPEAEAALRQAITVREQLVRDFPKLIQITVALGTAYDNLGVFLRDQGHAAASLEWFAKGMRILEAELARAPKLGYIRSNLRRAHSGRAEALDRLGRHTQAALDWDHASVLDDGQLRVLFQSRSALSRGDHARAVSLAVQQAQAKGVTGGTLHDCARACALAALAVKDDSSLYQHYVHHALDLLGRAVAKGYRNGPPLDLHTDKAFKALWGRTEFEHIVKHAGPMTQNQHK